MTDKEIKKLVTKWGTLCANVFNKGYHDLARRIQKNILEKSQRNVSSTMSKGLHAEAQRVLKIK